MRGRACDNSIHHSAGVRLRIIFTNDRNAIAAAKVATAVVAIPATAKAPRPSVAAAFSRQSQWVLPATLRPFSVRASATKWKPVMGGTSQLLTIGVHTSATVD